MRGCQKEGGKRAWRWGNTRKSEPHASDASPEVEAGDLQIFRALPDVGQLDSRESPTPPNSDGRHHERMNVQVGSWSLACQPGVLLTLHGREVLGDGQESSLKEHACFPQGAQ